LELVNPRLVLKLSVSGTKSWYLSVHARRLIATDDRLRCCGASDCRRPLPAKLALVETVVDALVLPVMAGTLLALFDIPTAIL